MINGTAIKGGAMSPRIFITSGGTRSAEDWGVILAMKLVEIADTAPAPIRDQAHEFQANLARVAGNYIDMAVKEAVNDIARKADAIGLSDFANSIRR